jgi:hypothetical protein
VQASSVTNQRDRATVARTPALLRPGGPGCSGAGIRAPGRRWAATNLLTVRRARRNGRRRLAVLLQARESRVTRPTERAQVGVVGLGATVGQVDDVIDGGGGRRATVDPASGAERVAAQHHRADLLPAPGAVELAALAVGRVVAPAVGRTGRAQGHADTQGRVRRCVTSDTRGLRA